ncbi:alpha-N-acetylgalactosamine-specific lectin-like [Apostichopus japonicus]|uniref:alpha-N-acetylgalactosamine-specific lectin-like n=1 Tax=Stichopus japonicus TaxID=307972 RepID=UPI003AB18705
MKTSLVVAVLLVSTFAETNGEFRCPKFWTEFNGHCYRYFNQPRLNFDASQSYCQNFRLDPENCSCKRASLVTVDSSEENTFLHEWWKSVREPISDTQHVRIGYTDIGSEGRWRWIDGSTSSYTRWDSGQPDNLNGDQHCAVIWKTTSDYGKWDDENCGYSQGFICEY